MGPRTGAIPRIHTERLALREWYETDRDAFAVLNADPAVMEYFPALMSRDESDALVDRIVTHWSAGYGRWAIERTEDAAFLGFVGLTSPKWEAAFTPAVEIGWRLGRAAWCYGYATEAARAAIRFGFEAVGLEEILSWTVPANLRSRAVMERLGMKRDPADDFDHPSIPAGHPLRRHVLYRLERSAWEAQ